MKSTRGAKLWGGLTIVALGMAGAWAEIPCGYYGCIDPVDVGWTVQGDGVGVSISPTCVDVPPYLDWCIGDLSTATGSQLYYEKHLTQDEITVAQDGGWTLRTKLHVWDGPAPSGSIFVSYYDGSRTWSMNFGGNGIDRTSIQLQTGLVGGACPIIEGEIIEVSAASHTYELSYSPSAGAATLRIDGAVVRHGYPGHDDTLIHSGPGVVWGSGSDCTIGSACYDLVEFGIGPDGGECLPVWDLVPTSGPAARRLSALAYDSDRHVTVLFGGKGAEHYTPFSDTWEWDGSVWSQRFVSGPGPRNSHAMVYDDRRKVVVCFGGCWSTSCVAETWEWDGVNWTYRPDVAGPSARGNFAMAFDSIRGVTVLHGGYGAGGCLGDTWEYDGTAWLQVADSGPSPRREHSMVFDSSRGVCVLFGGTVNGEQGFSFNDTWEWDGQDWTQVAAGGPARRYNAGFVYDDNRGVSVLYGGKVGTGFCHEQIFHNDTWEWDGVAWVQRATTSLTARYRHAMAYDSDRQTAILFGGEIPCGVWTAETWLYANDLALIQQPKPLILEQATTGSMTVVASGDGPYLHQWRREGIDLSDGVTPSGSTLSGTRTATLTITGAQPADGGSYDVLVSNGCGYVLSAQATLTVLPVECVIDLDDYAIFQSCMRGPADPGPLGPPCDEADQDGDGDIDLLDFARFQIIFGQPCL